MTTEVETSVVDFFQSAPHGALATMAAGAGDWSFLVIQEVDRILEQNKNDRPKAFAQGIDELLARKLVSREDAGRLKDIIAAFWAATLKKAANGSAEAKVIDGYRQLLLDPNASAPAIAIASVAARYTPHVETQSSASSSGITAALSITILPGSTGSGALGGAIMGAGVGGAVGGIVGAGIGAIIGAAAGGAVGWSNQKGK